MGHRDDGPHRSRRRRDRRRCARRWAWDAETDLLDPANTVQTTHAIVLGGGSAFGLAAADSAA